MRKKIGLIVIYIILLIPVIRWFFIEPLNYRFFNFVGSMTSIGQIAGILGFTMFAINLLLSMRLKIVEKLFKGLPDIYASHRQLGSVGFSLILFHPLFLVVSYLSVSLRAAMDFLTPFNNLAVTYGSISLFIMTVLIVLTFYIKLKYNHWKFSHKFMVIAFAFGLLHALFISSDISRDTFLRVYLFVFGFAGLAAGFYQSFLSQRWNAHASYTLKSVNILNEQVLELELEPKNKGIKFFPGQFVFISIKGNGISSESHPFSIASSSGDNNLGIIIKSLGDYTQQLKNLTPGLEVSVEGPFGSFSHLNTFNKNQIWIAGGVGITPFISMARSLQGDDYAIDLYYCVNKPDEALLGDEWNEIQRTKKIRLIPWCSSEKGRINAKLISELSAGLDSKDFMLCGPLPFMIDLKNQLMSLNIKKKYIHFENFNFI